MLLGLALASAMALAGAANAPPIDWSTAQTVTVVAVEYDFVPNHLSFRHGVAYRLRLENHGAEMHEFTAPKFFRSARIRDPDKLARDGTDLVVQPHETKDLYFVPERPGHYDFICADHDWAGMTGDITVD